jgi:hypothetical protein
MVARPMIRFATFALLVLASVAVGCTVKPPPPPTLATDCGAVKPLHVVIGFSAHDLTADVSRAALSTVLDQLRPLIRAGAPGMVVSAYPLSSNSIAANSMRLELACLSEPPLPPDLNQAPAFQRASLLETYRKAQAKAQLEDQEQLHQFDAYRTRVLAVAPPTASTDIWGFLALASDEFGVVEARERQVIIVSRDEVIQSTYCDGCHPLHGALVHFLAFDQPVASDQLRRRNDWAFWLAKVGAGATTFSRSNEPVPSFFGQGAALQELDSHA